jgi:phosphatidylethanolamine/phosphatidyl-N-methylethanolamine N-methyltransferase
MLYSRLSKYYDPFFRWVTLPRQKMLIQGIRVKPGARIMDLGVGTGLALPLYPRHCKVVGVDISPKMLQRARRRVRSNNLTHVELVQCDALDIDKGFPKSSFDIIIGAFILSVIDDPVRVLKNMKKVGKPDCSMFIINHLRSSHPLFAKCEGLLEPICKKLGWHFQLNLENALAEAGLRVVSQKPCYAFDLYSIVHVKNGNGKA